VTGRLRRKQKGTTHHARVSHQTSQPGTPHLGVHPTGVRLHGTRLPSMRHPITRPRISRHPLNGGISSLDVQGLPSFSPRAVSFPSPSILCQPGWAYVWSRELQESEEEEDEDSEWTASFVREREDYHWAAGDDGHNSTTRTRSRVPVWVKLRQHSCTSPGCTSSMEGRVLQREHPGGPGTHAPTPGGRRQCHAESRGQTEHRLGDKWQTRCRWGTRSRTTPSDTPAEVLHLGLHPVRGRRARGRPTAPARRYAESSGDEWEVSQDTSFPTLSLRRRNSRAATIEPEEAQSIPEAEPGPEDGVEDLDVIDFDLGLENVEEGYTTTSRR